MKYAVFSDMHGNLEAYQSVLDAMKKEGPSKYFCVGDIVSYGADPSACIDMTKDLNPAIVCGNHDRAAAGLTPLEYFTDYARAAVLWTRGVLMEEDREYLGSLKLAYIDKDLTMVHGTLSQPALFEYVFDFDTAYRMLARAETPVSFIGHSHSPGIFMLDDGKLDFTKGPKIRIEKDKKYLVNAGSVGQPRDGDWRAAFCIWDRDTAAIEIKRVEYDIKTAQKKILAAGLPKILAERLSEGR